MTFTLVISKKDKNNFEPIYWNIDETLLSMVTEKINQNSKVLDEKTEILLPMLDISKYGFFYKISSKISENVFCILENSENYNLFFNEIPFIKFKLLILKNKLDQKKVNLESDSLKSFSDMNEFEITTLSNNELQSNKTKNDLRPFITNAISLLDLFKNKTDDSTKTKTIETMKKNNSQEDFQLILNLAKLINHDIENLVTPFTKFEKKYTSFLNDL